MCETVPKFDVPAPRYASRARAHALRQSLSLRRLPARNPQRKAESGCRIPLTILAVKTYPHRMKKKNPALSEYFRAMGRKGGRVRAQKLSEERRKEIAGLGGRTAQANRKAASDGR
jgi:hypothetical protein